MDKISTAILERQETKSVKSSTSTSRPTSGTTKTYIENYEVEHSPAEKHATGDMEAYYL